MHGTHLFTISMPVVIRFIGVIRIEVGLLCVGHRWFFLEVLVPSRWDYFSGSFSLFVKGDRWTLDLIFVVVVYARQGLGVPHVWFHPLAISEDALLRGGQLYYF
jgi:hypothetical protein